ncbi:hypothetical protein JOB18_035226 [Solea senegalensis]|uniref:Secreted protein n=1 Tax=Solea senegalensis TaxID=28829 RepID=A0AAV6PI07_SOLSE|nr:hypothetical protein JOB18_035226 [Solea senegalensis]
MWTERCVGASDWLSAVSLLVCDWSAPRSSALEADAGVTETLCRSVLAVHRLSTARHGSPLPPLPPPLLNLFAVCVADLSLNRTR